MHPKVEKWANVAASLRTHAEKKLNPAIASQRYTRRRAGIAASMRDEGLTLSRAADMAERLAELWKHPPVPYPFGLLKSGRDLHALALGREPEGFTRDQADLARERLAVPVRTELTEAVKLREMLDAVRAYARNIPGFFPTPPKIVDLMIDCADIGPDVRRVLEPSAGIGSIVDRLKERHPHIETVRAVEKHGSCRNVLAHKGHEPLWIDFMQMPVPEVDEDFYDVVLMNPPFENGQDADHVMHAFKMLRPGGRLVAIVCEGLFFREDMKAIKFRGELCGLGAFSMRLAEDAFNGPDAFVPTGVRTRIVVIDKPRRTPELDHYDPSRVVEIRRC